jgi:nitrite reductase/ring-hydroxylating ferredoxin subunit
MKLRDRAPSCACDNRDRRAFLGDLASLAVGVLVALGASPLEARAASVATVSGAGAGDEKRYPLPGGDGVTIDRDNDVILARFQNRVYAFNLSCPHQNTALRWLGAEGRFQCPRHESKYKPDGTFISGRATRNMDRFAVRKDGGLMVVDLNRWFESDKQAAEWQTAFVAA